jgi:dolichyl-phosphate-mannose--protein O-mannosyl transferase
MANLLRTGASAETPAPETARRAALREGSLDAGADSVAPRDIPENLRIVRNTWMVAAMFGVAALALFIIRIDVPRDIHFDEVFYVPAARAILQGSAKMDPFEPPMGKLLMAAGIKMAGDNPWGWRLPSAICGALTLVAVFLWTHLLFGDSRIAFLAAGLTLFNNFLFVMSRIGMMDVFLTFFVFWGLVAYTAALKLEVSAAWRRMLICGSGVSMGLAGACKWNAVDSLVTLLGVGLVLPWLSKYLPARREWSMPRFAESLEQVGVPWLLFGLIVLPAVAYTGVYWILFRIVHLPFGIHQFTEMNYSIWRYHVADTIPKAVVRAWYQWPFMATPMRVFCHLLGNPVVMWGGVAGVFYCLWRAGKQLGVSEGLVALLYLANLFQWVVTPTSVTQYYYYYPAAMFLGVALAATLFRLPRRIFGIRVGPAVLVLAALFFLWSYPRMTHSGPPWDCMFGCWS